MIIVGSRPRWLEPTLVIAILGLLVSAYLTLEHLTSSTTLACPEGAVINCAKVTSGPWSAIVGIPVAVLGLGYFVIMTVLVSPAAWDRRGLDVVRVLGAVAGTVMVLYLIYVEIFVVGALCLWCTAVHLLTLALLATVSWRVVGREPVVSVPRS